MGSLMQRNLTRNEALLPVLAYPCHCKLLILVVVMLCAFTLTSGLEPQERNLREDLSAAYIGAPAGKIRNALRLEAVGKGANVLLMTPPEPDNSNAGGVFYHTRKLTNGLTGVNLIQLFVDFTLQSGRGEEQAEFLIEHALGFRELCRTLSKSRRIFLRQLFTGFAEEVNATRGPVHAAATFPESPRAADSFFELIQD